MRARVFVTLEAVGVRSGKGGPSVDALQSLGLRATSRNVRQGKYFELDSRDDPSAQQAERLAADGRGTRCWRNPVIESYRIEVELIMKFGIVVFPGSNCDEGRVSPPPQTYSAQDCRVTCGTKGRRPQGRRTSLILPGRFFGAWRLPAHPGAMGPVFSPVMAGGGGPFAEARRGRCLAICNGFQVLLESRAAARGDAAQHPA